MDTNRLKIIASALTVGLVLSSCGSSDPTPNAAQFCAEVADNRAAIVAPTVTSDLDIDAIVALHQRLGALAPLAISVEWSALTEAVETAATVVPNDGASVQRAVDAAYRSESAAVDVAEWVRASCGVDLGPVTTLVPHDQPEPATPVGADR